MCTGLKLKCLKWLLFPHPLRSVTHSSGKNFIEMVSSKHTHHVELPSFMNHVVLLKSSAFSTLSYRRENASHMSDRPEPLDGAECRGLAGMRDGGGGENLITWPTSPLM